MKDFKITPTDAQKQFKSSKYSQAIVTQLEYRFPDVGNLDTLSIFEPQKLLSVSPSDDEFALYGEERLGYLKDVLVMEGILILIVLNVLVSGKV